jgi:hypothetical protein
MQKTQVGNLYVPVWITPIQPCYKSSQDLSSERYWAQDLLNSFLTSNQTDAILKKITIK